MVTSVSVVTAQLVLAQRLIRANDSISDMRTRESSLYQY